MLFLPLIVVSQITSAAPIPGPTPTPPAKSFLGRIFGRGTAQPDPQMKQLPPPPASAPAQESAQQGERAPTPNQETLPARAPQPQPKIAVEAEGMDAEDTAAKGAGGNFRTYAERIHEFQQDAIEQAKSFDWSRAIDPFSDSTEIESRVSALVRDGKSIGVADLMIDLATGKPTATLGQVAQAMLNLDEARVRYGFALVEAAQNNPERFQSWADTYIKRLEAERAAKLATLSVSGSLDHAGHSFAGTIAVDQVPTRGFRTSTGSYDVTVSVHNQTNATNYFAPLKETLAANGKSLERRIVWLKSAAAMAAAGEDQAMVFKGMLSGSIVKIVGEADQNLTALAPLTKADGVALSLTASQGELMERAAKVAADEQAPIEEKVAARNGVKALMHSCRIGVTAKAFGLLAIVGTALRFYHVYEDGSVRLERALTPAGTLEDL